ncbi:bacillithiol biosynthesis cysteine-adding enzyme BshC [Anaerobacillus sp. MEB173]|uniref:bacillithiol biosynthesis cysteine-adding enzyme BshC n=1 Tax=Anaerobacillus sp. MEB173 TaxID=3383345 RepID=UPI003F8ED0DA
MIVKEMLLSHNKNLATDYLSGCEKAAALFDYSYEQHDFTNRSQELWQRKYDRESLQQTLKKFNGQFTYHEKAYDQIEKLKDKQALVVVGGQQAGLLTGPLYTIYKVLTILQIAKEQEEMLSVPVVPIFWIAGEDHDFAEINHLHVMKGSTVIKHPIQTAPEKKSPVSQLNFDHTVIKEWLYEIVRNFGETEHTKAITSVLEHSLEKSQSYVEFFGELISTLFKDTGIVLMDSADPNLRELEAPVFKKMIINNKELSELFVRQAKEVQQAGYGTPIAINEHNAHLFYHINGERVLLEREQEGRFRGKNNEFIISQDELLQIAENSPQQLSNNVVTRALMQEAILPVLAFVAGPGEVAYWATFKQLFHLFGYKIPPIIPRHQITIIDEQSQRFMTEINISLSVYLNGGSSLAKERWYQKQKQWDINGISAETKQQMENAHKQLRALANEIDPSLEKVAMKNYQLIISQIDFLERQLEKKVREKYEPTLRKFDLLSAMLMPNDQPQERIHNIFIYLNKYGLDFMTTLLNQRIAINEKHKVMYL